MGTLVPTLHFCTWITDVLPRIIYSKNCVFFKEQSQAKGMVRLKFVPIMAKNDPEFSRIFGNFHVFSQIDLENLWKHFLRL